MINQKGIDLIKSFEGLVLKAYVDPATGGEPITIGYGTTIYPDSRKVNLGDKCTTEQATAYLVNDINKFAERVKPLIKKPVNDNQFAALVSFAYNVGVGNLNKSTLLKLVNQNPADREIEFEFLKWNKAAGKVMNGLTRRRQAESKLYFS
jgi:lysozyme